MVDVFTDQPINTRCTQPMAWTSTNGTNLLDIGLVFAEVFVLISELILFNLLVKEHTVARRNLYVALANFASLILGGYLIAWLPI